jgi:hypothetical protein
MNAIQNFISRFFSSIITVTSTKVTVADAIADLDKAIVKLQKAEDHHYAQTTRFVYEAEVATKLAGDHEYASIRAARVRAKLSDLIG